MPVEHDTMQELLQQKAKNFLTFIPLRPESNEENMLLLRKELEQRRVVTIHGDRFFGSMRKIQVAFLGRPAQFPVGPYILAATAGKPVCFVSVTKTSSTDYEVVCTKPRNYQWEQGRSREDQIREWVTEYVRFLESQVSKYPEQWFNFYDFWAVPT
jgi:predicted LPLAT superfamily acyltransferase